MKPVSSVLKSEDTPSTKHASHAGTSAATAATAPSSQPIAVDGWVCAVLRSPSAEPPVIVNPNATSRDLLDWATGQLDYASQVTEILSTGTTNDAYLSSAIGAVHHFELQGLAVLRVLAERLSNEPEAI